MAGELRTAIERMFAEEAHPLAALWEWAKRPREEKERHKRWVALAEWAGDQKVSEQDPDAKKEWRKKQRIYRAKADSTESKPADPEVPGITSDGWHPEARRVGVVSGIGPLLKPVAGVLHTTEGYGVPSYDGSNPHFTHDPRSGAIYQHQSVFQGARALVNAAGGVETNRKAIQIENIAFAAQTQNWTEEMYANLADLMRWIEKHCGVERTFDGMKFPGHGETAHMSNSQWQGYKGWCGHCNVPENYHWDPGMIQVNQLV